VADAGNHAIRKIDAKGNVTTLAGTGEAGFADGDAGEAQFNSPQGIAIAADGTVYVADSGNHVIRAIAKDGAVTTLNAPSTRTVEVAPEVFEAAGSSADGKLGRKGVVEGEGGESVGPGNA